MYHIYTFGTGSKQGLVLTQKHADAINEFTDYLLAAQDLHKEKTGRQWLPTEPLAFPYTRTPEVMSAYHKAIRIANKQHWLRNKIFTLLRIDVRDEIVDDYLVKRV